MSDWIPNDIQRLILDKLSSPRDHARSSAVCKFWNSIYKERTFPWFVLTDHDRENHTRGFFSLHDQKIHRLNVPELEDKFICGSSHGWLITADVADVLCLYDPFSKVQFQLPPFPSRDMKFSTGNRPDGGCNINKVILSCDPRKNPKECMIFCIDGVYGVTYCKFEDKKWISFPRISPYLGHEIDDVIFYKGNFFIVHCSQVFICHLGSEPKFTPFGPEMPEKPEFAYLVNIEGSLALVNKYFRLTNPEALKLHEVEVLDEYQDDDESLFGDHDDDEFGDHNDDESLFGDHDDDEFGDHDDDEPIPEAHFDVYKLDEDNMRGWRKENNIGDQVMFLGKIEFKTLPASSFPNSIENSIYYGDRYVEPFFRGYYMDKGIFSLKDWKTVLLYPREDFDDMTFSPPIWLFQN